MRAYSQYWKSLQKTGCRKVNLEFSVYNGVVRYLLWAFRSLGIDTEKQNICS